VLAASRGKQARCRRVVAGWRRKLLRRDPISSRQPHKQLLLNHASSKEPVNNYLHHRTTPFSYSNHRPRGARRAIKMRNSRTHAPRETPSVCISAGVNALLRRRNHFLAHPLSRHCRAAADALYTNAPFDSLSAEKKLSLSAFILAFSAPNKDFLQIFCILVRLF